MAFDDDTCPACGITAHEAEIAGIPYSRCSCGYSREEVEYLAASFYGPDSCAKCYHSRTDHGWSMELEAQVKLHQAKLFQVHRGDGMEEPDFLLPPCARCVCTGFVEPFRVVAEEEPDSQGR